MIEKKFARVLKYIIEDFYCANIYDPSNTNNIVSDTISYDQKREIIRLAKYSYRFDFWEKVIWGYLKFRKIDIQVNKSRIKDTLYFLQIVFNDYLL